MNRYSLTDISIARNRQLSSLISRTQETYAMHSVAKVGYPAYLSGLHSETALRPDGASSHSHLMSYVNREDQFRDFCLLSYYNLRTLSQEAGHRFLKLSPPPLQPS